MQLWRYGSPIERLGKCYRLIRPLGNGGMADVCLAVDEQKNNEEVAIKVLYSADQLDEDLSDRYGDLLSRFVNEASLIAGWKHPNIIRIYGNVNLEPLDAKKGSMLPYIVMEYVRGGNLRDRLILNQPYLFRETLRLFTRVCSAVQYAHEHDIGVIHRDIKPENILFRQHPDGSEDVVLSDFGMAVSFIATHHTFPDGGSLPYMAPEQRRGQALPASDIYSLGVLLYRLCTGRLPFQLAQMVHPLPQPPRPSSINTALPFALDEIILTALADDPARRFPSARVFNERLQDIATSIPLSFEGTTQREISKRPHKPTIQSPASSPQPPAPEKNDAMREPLAGESFQRGQNDPAPVNASASIQNDPGPGVAQSNVPGAPNTPVASAPVEPVGQAALPAPPTTSVPEPVPSDGGSCPSIVELWPVSRGRSTVNLQARANAVASQAGGQALGVGAAASAGAMSAGTPTTILGGVNAPPAPASTARPAGGVQPLPRSNPPPRSGGQPPRRGRVLWLLLLLLLLTALVSGIVYASINPTGIQSLIVKPIANLVAASPAAITIVPDSKEVQAVATQPNSDQLQVAMRTLSTAPAPQNKTVTGTGHTQTAPATAKGRLTFINTSLAAFTVGAGTVINAANGVTVVTDQPAMIPAAVLQGITLSVGPISVSAHATTAGTAGNLDQGMINKTCCTTGNSILVRNDAAFAGGQDPQNYTFVQQADVNAAATPLESTATQQASALFTQQLKPNERFVGDPTCTSNVQFDPATVGDRGTNIASTAITVTAKCTGVAYDQGGAQAIARDRLQKKADIDPGQGYLLVGNIATKVSISKVNTDSIALVVDARGIWAYQFDTAKEQALAHQLVSKKVTDAQTFLNSQHGINNAKIVSKGDTLPTDPTQISFVIQKVPGETIVSNMGDNPVNPESTTTVAGNGLIPSGSTKG